MILDFPTKQDFFGAANDYLNSSWSSVIELINEFEELRSTIEDSKHEDESKRYWRSAKQTLISATALVQQAVEFYIKGEISDVSPYLLISGNPQNWPKGCNKNNIVFSSFRTLDAQDLLKVHDTVCEKRFSDKFIQWYESLRVIRNKVIHTVDKSLSVKPEEVMEFILSAHKYFSKSETWFESRRQYLKQTPINSMKIIQDDENSECYILQSLLIEFRIVIDVLAPSKIKFYLDFDKRAKSIHCPNCLKIVSRIDFWDHESVFDCGKTYQETNNTGVFECNLCHYQGCIVKKKCEEDGCESIFLDSSSGICLECFCETAL